MILKNYQLLRVALLYIVLQLTTVANVLADITNGTSGQCTWSFDDETGVLTISPGAEGGAMADYEYVNEGESVLDSYVNSPWWANRKNVKQVVINDGVTYIGKLAFNNCPLSEIVVPNSVTKIGAQAFMLCMATSITVGDGVTEIGDDALYCMPFTLDGDFVKQTVTIGSGLEKLGNSAFAYGTIGHLTFMGPAPTSWTNPPEADKISETVIHVTYDNYSGWIAAYPEYQPLMDWYAGNDQSTKWTSGDCTVQLNLDYTLTITGNGPMADYATVDDCPWKDIIGSISAVTVGEGVTTLSKNGFVGANNVTDVYLKGDPFTTWDDLDQYFNAATVFTCEKEGWYKEFPSLGGQFVTRCGDGVAWNYKNHVLTISKYAEGTGKMDNYSQYDDDEAPWNVNDLDLEMQLINIMDGVTHIGSYAFTHCRATDISMPESVTSIGEGAFRYSYIRSFELPAAMTDVPRFLFSGSQIEEVVLPEGVTSISEEAFLDCNQLTQVFLPSTLTSIGHQAFDDVTSAVDVYANSILSPNNVTWVNPDTDLSANAKVHVPYGYAGAWQSRFSTATVQWIDDAYTEDAPMELASTADWRKFRNMVASGATVIHAKMTADFTISDSDGYLGSDVHPYGGVFDGNGHTLTLDYQERGEHNDYRAPFRVIRGATLKNIHMAGVHKNYQYFSVFQGQYYRGSMVCGGMVARVWGTGNVIENCRVSLTFCYAGSYNSGLVAQVTNGASLTISNVLFDGRFIYGHADPGPMVNYNKMSTPLFPDNNAVFLADNRGTVSVKNCYINGELRPINGTSPKWSPCYLWAFNNAGTGSYTLTNCYYKDPNYHIEDPAATDVSGVTEDQVDRKIGPMWKLEDENNKVVLIPIWLFAMEGEGTEASPYLVGSADEWSRFIYYTTSEEADYKGKYWQQTADISTRKWGALLQGSDTDAAVYDGNEKTLTVDFVSDENFVAPFSVLRKGTVKGLIVDGTIQGNLHIAGMVGEVFGDENLITNSKVSVYLYFGTNNPHAGGFVGHANTSQLTVDGCLFAGTMEPSVSSSNSAAGAIVGWADSGDKITVTNCVEQGTYGTSLPITHKGMNLYITGLTVTPFGTNCLSFARLPGAYYPYTFDWDKEKFELSMGETFTEYPVAGIKSYGASGLYFGENYYAGEGQEVTFKLKTLDDRHVRSVKVKQVEQP